jgi:O-acetyl-ADP-ribose deacetylase (regulator of RNase III)
VIETCQTLNESYGMNKRIEIILGDITRQNTDAIVNAANKSLLGGGGVDGAIHDAAGEELLAECRTLNGCETGEAKITKGYKLKAKFVIHTVGPVWHGGNYYEKNLLASCYRNCLKLASDNKLKTIAFPSISTGAYRFPIEYASEIALTEIMQFFKSNSCIKKVIIVCFSNDVFEVYHRKLSKINKSSY